MLHSMDGLRAAPWHVQILASRASSAAGYEDVLSNGFTPETRASLLDFDTPMASPTSPGAHHVRAHSHACRSAGQFRRHHVFWMSSYVRHKG